MYDHVHNMPFLNVAKSVILKNLLDRIAYDSENGAVHLFSLSEELGSKNIRVRRIPRNNFDFFTLKNLRNLYLKKILKVYQHMNQVWFWMRCFESLCPYENTYGSSQSHHGMDSWESLLCLKSSLKAFSLLCHRK